MPSLEQLRYEALAAAVERATHPRLLGWFDPSGQSIEARVERRDGSTLDFKLKEVVLDGGTLVGRGAGRQAVVIPLAEVQAVWRRHYHAGRTAAVCGATMAFGAAAMPWVGAAIGLPVGGLIAIFLNQFGVLSEWALLYDRDSG